MATSGVMDIVTGLAGNATLSVEVIGLMIFVGLWFLSSLLAFFILRTLFSDHAAAFASYEQQNLGRLEVLAFALTGAARNFVPSTIEVLERIINTIKDNPLKLLGIMLFAALSILFLEAQPQLTMAYLTVRQGGIMPVIEFLPLRLANIARLVYDFVYPFVNVVVEVMWFATFGQTRLLSACTTTDDIRLVLDPLADAFTALGDALYTWTSSGFLTDTLDLQPTLAHLGTAADAAYAPLMCFCSMLEPVYNLTIAIPQLPQLQSAIGCGVNTAVRLAQMILNAIAGGLIAPDLEESVIEANCVVILGGEAVEEVFTLIVDMLLGLIAELVALVERDATIAASFPTGTPVTASTMYHATMRTSASPLRDGVHVSTPIWELPGVGDSLNETFGVQQLITLVSLPWSHIVTEPASAVLSLANMTWAAATHMSCPATCDCVMDSPLGLQYLQVGFLFDRMRTAVSVLAGGLVIFDANLPCAAGKIGEYAVTMVEAFVEVIFGFIIAIVYIGWLPGEGPDNCDIVIAPGGLTCTVSCSPFVDQTLFDFFPAYHDWADSALRRAQTLLLEDADCFAAVSGCHDPLDLSDECNDVPYACAVRKLYQFVVEAQRLLLSLFLYLPDLVRFDGASVNDYKTFEDIDLNPIFERWNEFFFCLTSWIDELDGSDRCEGTEPKFTGWSTEDNSNTQMPGAQDIYSMPKPYQYDCHNDGLAYWPDGRLYVARVPKSTNSTALYCDVLRENNTCTYMNGIQNGTVWYHLVVSGSPPQESVNITFAPTATWSGFNFMQPSTFTVDTSTPGVYDGTFTSAATNDYVDNTVITDCTTLTAPPLPEPFTPGLGCHSPTESAVNNKLFYRALETTSPYDELKEVYGYVEAAGTPDPDDALDFTDMSCTYDMVPQVEMECVVNFLTPGVGNILVTVPPFNIAPKLLTYRDPADNVEKSATCTGIGSPVSIIADSMCRYNQLYFVPGGDWRNATAYYIAGHREARIPCVVTMPTDWDCSATLADEVGFVEATVAAATRRLVYQLPPGSDPEYGDVPCRTNVAANYPQCIRLEVTYLTPFDNLATRIEVEGANVRVAFNKTGEGEWNYNQRFVCQELLQSNGALAAGTPLRNLQAFINETRTRVQHELRPHDMSAGVMRTQQTHGSTVYYMKATGNGSRVNTTLFIPDLGFDYRKDNLVCCVSEAVHHTSRFLSSMVLEIIITVRALLTLPATVPGFVFPVPTFEDARNELRSALCRLACVVTRVLPVAFSCESISGTIVCSNSPECAQGFLCAVTDVLLLIADIFVEILKTIKDIVTDGITAPTSALTNSAECRSTRDAVGCIANVFVYVVVKVVFALTNVARAVAANFDCFLCAITKAATPSAPCRTYIYQFVNAVGELIDGFANGILPQILKLVIYVGTAIVNFFTFQFGDFFDFDLPRIWNTIGTIFVDLADLIFRFLTELPFIGDVIRFVIMLVQGACEVVQDMLDFFSETAPDLNCDSIGTKRSLSLVGGWLQTLPVNITSAWEGPGGSAICAERVATHFNSPAYDYVNMASEEGREILFCLGAHHWVRPSAEEQEELATTSLLTHACDLRMAGIYAQNVAYPLLTPEERGLVQQCVWPRFVAQRLRNAGYNWVPQDLMYNYMVRLPLLFDELVFGYTVYSQYWSDRSTPAEIVVSPTYEANWAASGYATSHLSTLRAATAGATIMSNDVEYPTANLTAVDTLLGEDDAAAGLTIEQYAARAVHTSNNEGSRLGFGWRIRSSRTAAGVAKLWRSFLGSGAPPNSYDTPIARKRHVASASETVPTWSSPFVNLANSIVDRLAAKEVLDVPMNALKVDMLVNSSTRSRRQMGSFAMQALLHDPLVIGARVIRGVRDNGILTAGVLAATSVGTAVIGAGAAAFEIISGVAFDTTLALDAYSEVSVNTTVQWRVWPAAEGGLRNWGARLSAELGRVGNMTWQAGPARLAGSLQALGARSVGAAQRRASLLRFGSFLTTAALHAWRETRLNPEGRIAIGATVGSGKSGAVRSQNVQAAIDCLSPWQDLCDECLYADNAIGTAIGSIMQMLAYLAGPVEQEPSFAYSRAQFIAFNAYLDTPFSPAIVGDSPELPVRWPSPLYDPSRWLGDPTPNKIRFSDLSSLWDSIWGSISSAANDQVGASNTTRGTSEGWIRRTSQRRTRSGGSTINGQLASVFGDVIRANIATPPSVSATATGPEEESLRGWLDYFYGSVRSCSYRTELDGSRKRFSIGEGAAVVFATSAVISIFFMAPIAGNVFMLVGAVTGFSASSVLVFTLFVTYDFSYRCVPALPFQLADDLLYFLTHTLFSRCDWFWAGVLNEATYTNEACVTLASYTDGTFTAASCTDDVGFADFGFNLGFYMQRWWPAGIEYINTTQIMVISDLIATDWVQERLYTFSDPTTWDAVRFSQVLSCGYQYTGIPNAMIFMAFLYLVSLLFPFVTAYGNIALSLVSPTFFALLAALNLSLFPFILPSLVSQHTAIDPNVNVAELAYRPATNQMRSFALGRRIHEVLRRKQKAFRGKENRTENMTELRVLY